MQAEETDKVSIKDAKPIEIAEGMKRYILLAGEKVCLDVVIVKPKEVKKGEHGIMRHDYEEMIYILEGELELVYPEVGKKFLMKAGDSKFHPIGTAHTAGELHGDRIVILEVTSPPGHGYTNFQAGRD